MAKRRSFLSLASLVKPGKFSPKRDIEIDDLGDDETCMLTDSPLRLFKFANVGNLVELERCYNQNNSLIHTKNSKKRTVLHIAAAKGHVPIIDFCVNHGSDIDAQDCIGDTPLHVAVENNQVSVTKYLLKYGANTNILNNKKMAAIHIATSNSQEEVLKILCECREVDVNLPDGETSSIALHRAAGNDDVLCLKILLKNDANVYAKCKKGGTPFHAAAHNGAIHVLEEFLKLGRENDIRLQEIVNIANVERFKPLHSAVSSGNTEVVRICIMAGADIDTNEGDLSTPLHLACAMGKTEMVKVMVEALNLRCSDSMLCAINYRDQQRMTPLHHAAMFDHYGLIEYLVDSGAEVNAADMFKRTPLLLAMSKNACSAVKILLERGADIMLTDQYKRNFIHLAIINHVNLSNLGPRINQKMERLVNEKDNFGCTPLHYASKHGYLVSLNTLINHGVEMNLLNNDNESPLHFAARYGRYQSCKKLLDSLKGPGIINQTDGHGQSALHKAAKNGHYKVVQLLLRRGAIFMRDYSGYNPFHIAAENGYVKTMKAFAGVHSHILNSRNNVGNTALHITAMNGHADAVTFLLDIGVQLDVYNDDGYLFIDLVVQEKLSDVGLAVIHNKRWKEAMALSSQKYVTPFLGLIKELPDVCLVTLDQCQTLVRQEQYKCGKTVSTWNYDFTLLQTPMHEMTDLREKGEEYTPLIALNKMIKFQRIGCLGHPVLANYLNMKWNAYGKWCHYANLFVYWMFLAILTTVVILHKGVTVSVEDDSNNTTSTYRKIVRPNDVEETVFLCLGMIFCAFNIIKEFCQMWQQRYRYLQEWLNNLLEWCLYLSASTYFIVRLDPNLCAENPQVTVSGALAVLLAWVNLLLFFQRSDRFGIYVVMYWEILKTLLEVLFAFFGLFVAFGLAFYSLTMPDKFVTGFATPAWAMFRIGGMFMVQLEDIMEYLPNRDPFSNRNFTHQTAIAILLVVFTLFMPILLMNMLIGLAVGDIDSIQRNARIKRIALQADFHSELERKLPRKWLEKSDQVTYQVGPNGRGHECLGILKYILTMPFTLETKTNADEYQNMDEKLRSSQQAIIYEELYKQKLRLKDLTTTIEKQYSLTRLIVQKMEIETEAEETDEGSLTTNALINWKKSFGKIGKNKMLKIGDGPHLTDNLSDSMMQIQKVKQFDAM
ncbi:transient receptor potential cation channel subfamily A member 1-like [Tubulanus polymorphus]|uniref:transient receptor potential cation channel subfamily A member 1-like n=1 Tax=Tubulanus polymorphus TaxID=672921 RepID=UPI003DA5903D